MITDVVFRLTVITITAAAVVLAQARTSGVPVIRGKDHERCANLGLVSPWSPVVVWPGGGYDSQVHRN